MPVLSAALKAAVDPQVTKVDWSSTAKTLLTNTRRLEGWWISNAASDPTTGTKFLDVGSIGELPVTAGNISGFGTLTGVTTRAAANLATGAAALVLRGNGHTITYTLGLSGSGKEFIISSSPTGSINEGFAFAIGSGMKAPVFLDSGTGPLSPAIDPTIVVAARLCDWSSGSRVVVGTLNFSKREPNMVMEHPWMAAEHGDVRRMRTPDNGQISWGTGGDSYQIGGELLIANKVVNGEAAVPLQQVRIRMRPGTNRWANWPFEGGFNIATDTMAPPAHKFELLNGNGDIVGVIELYSTRDANNTPGSGWPVNDPRIKQDWHAGGAPVQCSWTCRMVHFWESNSPKVHSKAFHILPGVEAQALDPKNVSAFSSDGEQWPVFANSFGNGLGSYRLAPKWSRAKDGGFDTTIIDTAHQQPARDFYFTQAIGYGFEPGASGGHGWFTAPGGTRHYRAAYPHGVMFWASKPNENRVHGNVPWREMLKHWMQNYFNWGHHYFTDVNTGAGIKEQIKARNAGYKGGYYGSPVMANPATQAIHLLAFTNGQTTENSGGTVPYRDKNGNRFSNECARDLLHSYSNAGMGAYITVSAAHAIEAAHSFISHLLAVRDLTPFTRDSFLIRAHAWHMWNYANLWVVSNNHPEGFTMQEAEQLWAQHLEECHDAVRPEYDAQNTIYGVSLKRFGIHMRETANGDGTFRIEPNADLDSKVFYFAQVFMLMKQSGSYDRMRAYSPKCKWTIDTIFDCLNTYAVGVVMDSNGRYDRYGAWRSFPVMPHVSNGPSYSKPVLTAGGIANLPPTWNELYPAEGQDDWIHLSDGSMVCPDFAVDNVNTKHFRAQWLWLMKSHFQEKTIPRLDQAVARIDDWYAQVEAVKDTIYWAFRFSMMGKLNNPDYVGAIV